MNKKSFINIAKQVQTKVQEFRPNAEITELTKADDTIAIIAAYDHKSKEYLVWTYNFNDNHLFDGTYSTDIKIAEKALQKKRNIYRRAFK